MNYYEFKACALETFKKLNNNGMEGSFILVLISYMQPQFFVFIVPVN